MEEKEEIEEDLLDVSFEEIDENPGVTFTVE